VNPHASKTDTRAGNRQELPSIKQFLGVFRYSRRALDLVWDTSRGLTLWLALLTVIAGILPAAVAYIGQLIVDSVVAAANAQGAGADEVVRFVVLEGLVVVAVAAAQRGMSVCQSLLRALLGQRVNVMILEKAQTLQLRDFEDSEFYDKLVRARREASQRPLSLVTRTFGLLQNLISLVSYAFLLIQFSPWAVVVLLLAGLPAFVAETKFAGDAFRLFRWRSPETRMQIYLETVLTREDGVKEVKLFQMGPRLLQRYRDIFKKLFKEDRKLTIRRDSWGFVLGVLGSIAFYVAYAWIALTAVKGQITLGQMTMYLMVFRQGQAAVSAMLTAIGGMYEDNLYLSNLYEYLEQPALPNLGELSAGPAPDDGIRFEGVSFQYPGAAQAALENINLHLKPGQSMALVGENGSGKTTLIKLLSRLYDPTEGRILLDGADLKQWNVEALRERIGVIFQDFGRYQFTVGENIGTGDVRRFDDESGWQRAADMAKADDFIQAMPKSYQTQLGRWFKGGRELSGGQWQKVALSRAFMREQADILVLDEPTAAIDARAEAEVFEHFRQLSHDKITILISHRFSTVRMADHIVVIEKGQLIEQGSHEELMQNQGHYAQLFTLQAKGYQ
jgi:ATP-binding cassette subfamily B protein